MRFEIECEAVCGVCSNFEQCFAAILRSAGLQVYTVDQVNNFMLEDICNDFREVDQ